MKEFIRRELLNILFWTFAAVVLWYGLYVDRAKLGGAIGMIAIGIAFEVIHRVFGRNSEDRA